VLWMLKDSVPLVKGCGKIKSPALKSRGQGTQIRLTSLHLGDPPHPP